jgi:translation initiation factor IF-2
MGKRVFEFAKELGLTSKEVLERCKKLGFSIASQLTVMEEKIQSEIRKDLGLISDVGVTPPVHENTPHLKTTNSNVSKPPVAAPLVPATGTAVAKEVNRETHTHLNFGPTATYPTPPPRMTTKTPVKRSLAKPIPVKTGGHGLAAGKPTAKLDEKIKKEEPQPEPVAEQVPITKIKITEGITVSELARKLNVKANILIKELMDLKILATMNQKLEMAVAETLASAHNAEVEVVPLYGQAIFEELIESDPKDFKPRPPVVTIMGHVDHGKTLLLDAIRKSNLIGSEAGGITQHIGAYQVQTNRGIVTFLDTPGHEAFTMMRARGIKVTDVVILVVAADDGVMPQTIEAIDHAKEAKVPVVVAINKIDKPEANVDRVKSQLSEFGLVSEEWGGKTIFVPISAKKLMNLDKLLEMVLLEAEILELKANPNRPAKGVVLDARLDKGRGPVATLLIQDGTLRIGDDFLAGNTYGRVRAMHNDLGVSLKSALPATPVEILGLSDVPQAGDLFYVVTDSKIARDISEKRVEAFKNNRVQYIPKHITLDNLFEQIREGQIKELKVIVKGDVQGSVEALTQSLEKLSTEKVILKVIHRATGDVVNSDILLASASNAIVIGFHIKVDPNAKVIAEKENVDIRLYNIIYDVIEDVRKSMEGLLEPHYRLVLMGKAEIRQIFKVPQGNIAGCMVLQGKILKQSKVKIIRNNQMVFEGSIQSLKHFKDDVKEVLSNFECGIGIENFDDLQIHDVIEAYATEMVSQKLN